MENEIKEIITPMVNKKSWEEFREAGLLWWINTLLHTFGWAIVYDFGKDGELISIYPARVKFRGFSEDINSSGYVKISKFMKDNAEQLLRETKE